MRCIAIEHRKRLVEHILVGHSPNVCKVDVARIDLAAVNHFVTVVREKVAHVVEIAVATIEVLTTIAQPFHHLGNGKIAHAVGFALNNALACTRRNAQRERLKPTHRAITGGIKAVEHQTLPHQTVQIGRDMLRVSVTRKKFSAEAFHRDEHNIGTIVAQLIAHNLATLGIQAR